MTDTVECLFTILKHATNRSIAITFLQNCVLQTSDNMIGQITFSKVKLTATEKILFFPSNLHYL